MAGEQASPPLPPSTIRNSRLAALPLAKLLCSLGLLRPVSRTARGLRAPHQFPLKSYGFSGAETARKRFLLWKMGFSDAAYCELLHPSIQHGRPLRSQARLRHSLLHWAYFALFRPQGARFVRPPPYTPPGTIVPRKGSVHRASNLYYILKARFWQS